MANLFIQRQFTGFLGSGESTLATTVGLPNTVWQSNDVPPSHILKLDPGLFSTASAVVPAALSATHTVALPQSYTSDQRLSFTLKTSGNIRVTVTSPDHPNSVTLVYAPEDSSGFYATVQTVTAITVVSLSDTDTEIEYACFTVPDLNSPASWRGGYQTVGVVST